MKENPTDILFSGTPEPFGGLTNEHELVKRCPEDFKGANLWSSYASKVFFLGADIQNWGWKSADKEIQKRQLGCLKGLLSTYGIAHEDKEAVAGWMLSEMLTEVPEYLPPEGN